MEKTEMKELFREAWKEVFQKDAVGDEDNFFESGGDSIKAVQLASWLAQKGIKLELGTVFTSQTFGAIAESLSETTPMYVPPEIMTKEIANREFGFAGGQGNLQNAQAASMANQQLCDPANNQQAASMANQQLCDPANNQQAANMANQQLCDPANNLQAANMANQQLCDPANNLQAASMANQQLCDPANNTAAAAMAPYAQMMPAWSYGMSAMPSYGVMFMPVLVPLMPMMGAMPQMFPASGMPMMAGMQGMPQAGTSMMSGMPQFSPEQINRFQSYFAKPIESPVENPNVVKINKPTVGKAEKSAEEVLDYVLNGLIPGYNKEDNLFQQGLSSLDVMKIITRCAEYGYQLEMETVFLTPTFREIAAEMKGNK